MKYCYDCEKLVEGGLKEESFTGEAWGSKFIQTDDIPCCSECGGENIEDAYHCIACKAELIPFPIARKSLCENCEDEINVIKDEFRVLTQKVDKLNRSEYEEIFLQNIWGD